MITGLCHNDTLPAHHENAASSATHEKIESPMKKSSSAVTAELKPARKCRSPNNTQKKTRQRRVSFEVDENDNIIDHVHTQQTVELSEDDTRLLWWQPEESLDFKRRAKRAASFYHETERDTCPYLQKFKEAYEMCSTESGHLEGVPLVSDTPARGLEFFIFPEMLQQRKKVVKAVLAAQRTVPENIDPVNRARLLNATSKHVTRPMRRLARVLAIGDARAAANVNSDSKE